MKAGVDAPEPALEQGREGSGVASGSGMAGFFRVPVGRWAASHMPVDTAQNSANAMTRMRRSSRPGSLIWAVFEPEAAALEVGEHGLDAPAQAIIEGRVDRGCLGQGDDPGFGMAGLVHHGDVGAHAFLGQLNVPQPVLAAPEARRQRGLAAVLEHESNT